MPKRSRWANGFLRKTKKKVETKKTSPSKCIDKKEVPETSDDSKGALIQKALEKVYQKLVGEGDESVKIQLIENLQGVVGEDDINSLREALCGPKESKTDQNPKRKLSNASNDEPTTSKRACNRSRAKSFYYEPPDESSSNSSFSSKDPLSQPEIIKIKEEENDDAYDRTKSAMISQQIMDEEFKSIYGIKECSVMLERLSEKKSAPKILKTYLKDLSLQRKDSVEVEEVLKGYEVKNILCEKSGSIKMKFFAKPQEVVAKTSEINQVNKKSVEEKNLDSTKSRQQPHEEIKTSSSAIPLRRKTINERTEKPAAPEKLAAPEKSGTSNTNFASVFEEKFLAGYTYKTVAPKTKEPIKVLNSTIKFPESRSMMPVKLGNDNSISVSRVEVNKQNSLTPSEKSSPANLNPPVTTIPLNNEVSLLKFKDGPEPPKRFDHNYVLPTNKVQSAPVKEVPAPKQNQAKIILYPGFNIPVVNSHYNHIPNNQPIQMKIQPQVVELKDNQQRNMPRIKFTKALTTTTAPPVPENAVVVEKEKEKPVLRVMSFANEKSAVESYNQKLAEINMPESQKRSTDQNMVTTIEINDDDLPNTALVNKTQSSICLLMPWLKNIEVELKMTKLKNIMLEKKCLYADFKCLSERCTYYTSNSRLFRKHLLKHFQDQFANTLLGCPYCEHRNSSIDNIISHITNQHEFDKYLCPYCFYRSAVDCNVFWHIKKYHPYKDKVIYEKMQKSKPETAEFEFMLECRQKFVPAIICAFCRKNFYIFESFQRHLNVHNETISTKCTKCDGKIEKKQILYHLKNCYGYGNYQCIYCKYGSDDINVIRMHLADNHPTRLTFACHRQLGYQEAPNDNTVNSTRLLKISSKLPSNIFLIYDFPAEVLENEANVHRINNQISITAPPPPPKSISTVETDDQHVQKPPKPLIKIVPKIHPSPVTIQQYNMSIIPRNSTGAQNPNLGRARTQNFPQQNTQVAANVQKEPIQKNVSSNVPGNQRVPQFPQNPNRLPVQHPRKSVDASNIQRRNETQRIQSASSNSIANNSFQRTETTSRNPQHQVPTSKPEIQRNQQIQNQNQVRHQMQVSRPVEQKANNNRPTSSVPANAPVLNQNQQNLNRSIPQKNVPQNSMKFASKIVTLSPMSLVQKVNTPAREEKNNVGTFKPSILKNQPQTFTGTHQTPVIFNSFSQQSPNVSGNGSKQLNSSGSNGNGSQAAHVSRLNTTNQNNILKAAIVKPQAPTTNRSASGPFNNVIRQQEEMFPKIIDVFSLANM